MQITNKKTEGIAVSWDSCAPSLTLKPAEASGKTHSGFESDFLPLICCVAMATQNRLGGHNTGEELCICFKEVWTRFTSEQRSGLRPGQHLCPTKEGLYMGNLTHVSYQYSWWIKAAYISYRHSSENKLLLDPAEIYNCQWRMRHSTNLGYCNSNSVPSLPRSLGLSSWYFKAVLFWQMQGHWTASIAPPGPL